MISTIRLRKSVSASDHFQGSSRAVLTLVEYGDYQCPFCEKAYFIVKRLQQEFGGDLRFVFRNFPLTTVHPFAMEAAQAAEAAALQDKFWEMHDVIFENQAQLDRDSLFRYAEGLRLNQPKFIREMGSEGVMDKITQDLNMGVRSGVNGTPTFFVEGFRYDGDWSYEALSALFRRIIQEMGDEEIKIAG